MKTERLLDELRERLDIVDVISDYLELKHSGQNYKGLCPFHTEKTPSFMVSPEKQIFHCFGCGIGGNIVNFIMKYENLSFHESLKFLAKKAGIPLRASAFDRDQEGLRGKLLDILKETTRLFQENLRKSKTAYAYLRERGITDETIRLFSLGYAMRDWHLLSRALTKKGFPDPLLLQSGVVSSGEKGIYDTFRDRIMFSIANTTGDVIAFGGRVMDDAQPKYLNSPDTPLFKKGETLYGLDLAKEGIRKKGYAVIVEGYFDVMVCRQYGFHHAVAPLGTALTQGHLQKLKRFTKKTVLVFDGDEAGKSAAKRSVPILLEQGFSAKILLLPHHDDPDSFLRREGDVPFSKLLSKSRSVIDFILNSSQKDKTETVHEALEIIASAADTIMREELISELSRKAGMSEAVIRERIKRSGKRTKEDRKEGRPSPQPSPSFRFDEEVLLLSAILAFPDRLESIVRMIPLEEFRNPTVRSIMQDLDRNRGERLDSILSSLGDEEKALVTGLTVCPGFDLEIVDKNIEDCIRKISMRKFDERNRQAEGTADPELLNSLLLERRRFIKEAK
jgi:DNA primase